MTISIYERPLSREFDNTSGRIGFLAIATEGETEAEIKAAVEAEAPATYASLPLNDVRAQEIDVNPDEAFGPLTWDVEVRYGGRIAIFPQTGDVIWSGTTAGGTERITHGIKFREDSTPGTYDWEGPSFTAWRATDWPFPAKWGAIGATKDGVAGVDIVVPIDSFQAVKYVPAEDWPTLKAACDALTGRTNNDTWTADAIEYAEGEVLFLGLGGWIKRNEFDDYEVTFLFAAGKTITGIEIGDVPPEPPLIDKAPWDYLDITYEAHQESGDKVLIQRPVAVTVHRVYRSGNFGALGLDP